MNTDFFTFRFDFFSRQKSMYTVYFSKKGIIFQKRNRQKKLIIYNSKLTKITSTFEWKSANHGQFHLDLLKTYFWKHNSIKLYNIYTLHPHFSTFFQQFL